MFYLALFSGRQTLMAARITWTLSRSKHTMWPFSNKTQIPRRWPTVSVGNITATWSNDCGWSFVDPVLEVDCTTHNNDEFHESLVANLPIVREWISHLSSDILDRVNTYAEASTLPLGVHDIQEIDLSSLTSDNQIDICYSAEEWADFAINVIIKDGQIADVYGGD